MGVAIAYSHDVLRESDLAEQTPPPTAEDASGGSPVDPVGGEVGDARLYRLGLALFSFENPTECRLRGNEWTFGPEAPCEKTGVTAQGCGALSRRATRAPGNRRFSSETGWHEGCSILVEPSPNRSNCDDPL